MILLIRWRTERNDTLRSIVKEIYNVNEARQLAEHLICYKDTVPHIEGDVIIDSVYVFNEDQRIPSDFKFN